jgi:hypothetical protein
MFKLLGNSDNSLPAAISNPFSMENVTGISMHATEDCWEKSNFRFWGYVEFKNGDTSGKQEFKASSFGELYMKIYNFCEQLGVKRY